MNAVRHVRCQSSGRPSRGRSHSHTHRGHGLGELKDFQLKLNTDDTVTPVNQTHRRVAFGSREKVAKSLKQLYDEDICETPKNTPTPWVSRIVVVPKPRDPDSVRICIDMRAANKAIQRVKHPMPTVHELIHDLNGCTVFTKLDLNQGYHQIELHPDSSHVGLHRYKRLNFGVNAASEKFQQIIEQVLEGLDGMSCGWLHSVSRGGGLWLLQSA